MGGAWLEPAVEPAEVEVVEALQGGAGAEVDIAGVAEFGGVGAVGPRAHDGVDGTLFVGGEGLEAVHGGEGVGVVPGTDEVGGNVGILLQVLLDAETGLTPEVVVVGLGVDVEEPAFVVGYLGQGAVAFFEGEAGEPIAEVGVVEGVLGARVGLEAAVGVGGGVPEGPCHEAELEGAALTDGAGVGVPTGHGGNLAGEMGRVEGGHAGLGPAGVGGAEGADLAVAPRLVGDPFNGVVAVVGLVTEEIEVALGVEAATAVLDDDDVAVTGEVAGALGALGFALAVGGALEEDGEGVGHGGAVAGGEVDVVGQGDAVAGGGYDVLPDEDFVGAIGASHGRGLLLRWSSRSWSGNFFVARARFFVAVGIPIIPTAVAESYWGKDSPLPHQAGSQCGMPSRGFRGSRWEGVGTTGKRAAGREKRGEMPYKGGFAICACIDFGALMGVSSAAVMVAVAGMVASDSWRRAGATV